MFPCQVIRTSKQKKRTALPVLPACLCICLSLLGLFKSEANFESRHVLDKVVLNEKTLSARAQALQKGMLAECY